MRETRFSFVIFLYRLFVNTLINALITFAVTILPFALSHISPVAGYMAACFIIGEMIAVWKAILRACVPIETGKDDLRP